MRLGVVAAQQLAESRLFKRRPRRLHFSADAAYSYSRSGAGGETIVTYNVTLKRR